MMLRPDKLVTTFRVCVAAMAASSMLVIVIDRAVAQIAPSPASSLGLQEQGQPPAAPQGEPAPQASPQPPDSPGLIHEMGKLFDKSLSVLPSLKNTGETLDGLNARAKNAVEGAGDALSRVAKPGSMVSGRVNCPGAATGTPDCKAAADWLCKTKGYKEGNSLNTDSAEKCSAKVMIPGRQRQANDCHTENYVTSALCQ
jgi:hypothetical protein